ncbi:hypothetical protein OY671_010027, partial [Metschnikowia pulcherrima]
KSRIHRRARGMHRRAQCPGPGSPGARGRTAQHPRRSRQRCGQPAPGQPQQQRVAPGPDRARNAGVGRDRVAAGHARTRRHHPQRSPARRHRPGRRRSAVLAHHAVLARLLRHPVSVRRPAHVGRRLDQPGRGHSELRAHRSPERPGLGAAGRQRHRRHRQLPDQAPRPRQPLARSDVLVWELRQHP